MNSRVMEAQPAHPHPHPQYATVRSPQLKLKSFDLKPLHIVSCGEAESIA